mmetsp:Transcript_8773/g.17667  ORF Transcript_8773/g.17667 Transcript_8773/m.17667 type:complete len:108 (+) Transcript_8773:46-369(+)
MPPCASTSGQKTEASEQTTDAAVDEHATGADSIGDNRAAFLQASADLLLNISPSLQISAPTVSPNNNDALLQLAHSVMEAQAPRPTFSDFASVPADNPFGSSPTVSD